MQGTFNKSGPKKKTGNSDKPTTNLLLSSPNIQRLAPDPSIDILPVRIDINITSNPQV